MVIEPALVIAPVALVTLIVLFARVIVAPVAFVSPFDAPVPLSVSVAPLVVKVRLPPFSVSELILRSVVALMIGLLVVPPGMTMSSVDFGALLVLQFCFVAQSVGLPL
jgi:hypothetical protein